MLSVDAATILDDSEKTDAGEFRATTGDELATEQPEAEEAIASESMSDDDELRTAGDMVQLFPEIDGKKTTAQKFRDWAMGALKSDKAKGKQVLDGIGYKALAIPSSDKTNYFFRKLP